MSNQRINHHKEDEEIAYRLQVMGAREGAIKGTLIAGAIVLFCNYRFPFMRRQTLAGKAFLTSWGTVFGMVIYADHYLLDWEKRHRAESEQWRSAARKELSAQGLVPSESSMRKWKATFDAEKAQREAGSLAAPTDSSVTDGAAETSAPVATGSDSVVLQELRKAKQTSTTSLE